MSNNNKVFVGNLSWSATDQDLEDTFASFGNITEAKIVLDRESNKSRGFGFVTFASDAEASKAVAEMDGRDMMGRPVAVKIAENKPRGDRGAGSGDRRGGYSPRY